MLARKDTNSNRQVKHQLSGSQNINLTTLNFKNETSKLYFCIQNHDISYSAQTLEYFKDLRPKTLKLLGKKQ